jgi:hypothetical protein
VTTEDDGFWDRFDAEMEVFWDCLDRQLDQAWGEDEP